MNKENILVILRALLSAAGAWLIGKNFLGNPVDEVLWQGIVGSPMAIAAFVWTVREKAATVEQWQGIARQTITFFGGLFVATGKLTSETLTAITGFAIAIIPLIQSFMSRKKAEQLKSNHIQPNNLVSLHSKAEK